MGFYNIHQGDVPYFKTLVDNYAMSDNFHQSVNGGTGANHIMLGHGDAIWFSNGKGNAATPPHINMPWSIRERRMRAPSMKSKIRILPRAQTTGTSRTATAQAGLARLFRAAVLLQQLLGYHATRRRSYHNLFCGAAHSDQG